MMRTISPSIESVAREIPQRARIDPALLTGLLRRAAMPDTSEARAEPKSTRRSAGTSPVPRPTKNASMLIQGLINAARASFPAHVSSNLPAPAVRGKTGGLTGGGEYDGSAPLADTPGVVCAPDERTGPVGAEADAEADSDVAEESCVVVVRTIPPLPEVVLIGGRLTVGEAGIGVAGAGCAGIPDAEVPGWWVAVG